MRIKIFEDKEDLVYRVIDSTGVTEEALYSMYYSKVCEYFEKRLPLTSIMFKQDYSDMEVRYNSFVQKEILREFKTDCFEKALLKICEEHKNRGINWWLAGSAALYARGIDITPHDIDIMTYLNERSKISEFVSPFIVEPFHNVVSWVVKGFGVIDLGVRVDYAFEPESYVDNDGHVDFGPYAESHLEKIVWKGYEIMVPPVELHLKSNIQRQRKDVVKKIQDYLLNN